MAATRRAGSNGTVGIMDLEGLPGAAMVAQGLRDLAAGVESQEALVVAIAAPRLGRLGLEVPASPVAQPELRLYEMLACEDADSAHSRYNALIRLVVSFARAAACAA